MSKVEFESDSFGSTGTVSAQLRKRTGKIFEVGEYLDKNFSLTEAEADAAIADFTPCAADLEHRPTVLDGKLGRLVKVWRQGTELFGTAEVPAWLDDLLDDTERRISLAWDRATKRIVGWGWVRTPRVTDAALMAAFAETEEFAGRAISAENLRQLQDVHDTMVAHGAACAPATLSADFAGRRHAQRDVHDFQRVHDLVVRLGAACAVPESPPPATMSRPASKEKRKMGFLEQVKEWANKGFPADFALTEAEAEGEGTGSAVTRLAAPLLDTRPQMQPIVIPVYAGGREQPQGQSQFSGDTKAEAAPVVDAEAIRTEATEAARQAAQAEFTAEQERLRAEFAAQQADLNTQLEAERQRAAQFAADLAAARTARIAGEAEVFANTLITSNRLLPKHAARVRALFCALAADDVAQPVEVTFSTEAGTDTKASRLDTLRELLNDLEPHTLTADFGKVQVLGNSGAGAGDDASGISAERRAHLMSLTPLGEKALGGK